MSVSSISSGGGASAIEALRQVIAQRQRPAPDGMSPVAPVTPGAAPEPLMLGTGSGADAEALFRAVVAAADGDSDGGLAAAEIDALAGGMTGTTGLGSVLVGATDGDGDGRASADELLAALHGLAGEADTAPPPPPPPPSATGKDAVDDLLLATSADNNGDGRLSATEVTAAADRAAEAQASKVAPLLTDLLDRLEIRATNDTRSPPAAPAQPGDAVRNETLAAEQIALQTFRQAMMETFGRAMGVTDPAHDRSRTQQFMSLLREVA